MVDFMNQFNQSLRGGMLLGQGMAEQRRAQQAQDMALREQAMQEDRAARQRKAFELEQITAQKQQQRLEREDKTKLNAQVTAGLLSTDDPAVRKKLMTEMMKMPQYADDPNAAAVFSDLLQKDVKEQDKMLLGLLGRFTGEVQKKQKSGDQQVADYFGIPDIKFSDLPAEDKSTYIYAMQSPEYRELIKERVNLRDPTPSEVKALEDAKNEAARQGEALNAQQKKFRGFVAQGINADSQIKNLNRAIQIQNDLETGGIQAARNKLRNYFGVEAPENASFAELNSLYADVVLGRLRSLGANPTEGERSFLTKAVGEVEQTGTANLAILNRALEEAKRQKSRGINAYQEIIKDTPDYRSETYDSIFNLTAPQNPATQEPRQTPVGGQQPSVNTTYTSMDEVFTKYGDDS